MISRRRILGTMGVLAAVSLQVGCGNRGVLRYRLSVEIDTPGGLKIGSAVQETAFPGNGLNEGPAPYVEVAPGRHVFALMSGGGRSTVSNIVVDVLRDPQTKPQVWDVKHRPYTEFVAANARKPFGVVRRDSYPMLVTFGDLTKPSSVEEVDPENLAAQFGTGYSCRRITFQVVDKNEPITNGIEEVLPWLDNYTRGNLKGQMNGSVPFSDNSTASMLNALSFRWMPK